MNLFPEEMRRDPYPLYDQMRGGSPVLHVAPLDLWMIFDHEGVKRALTDHEAFSSVVTPVTGKAPDWLIFSDPPRGERLTDDEILGFFQVLLAAGTETTTNLIDNAILCLIEHPEELARLRRRRGLTGARRRGGAGAMGG